MKKMQKIIFFILLTFCSQLQIFSENQQTRSFPFYVPIGTDKLNFEKTAFNSSVSSPSFYAGAKEAITTDSVKKYAITKFNSLLEVVGITPEKIIMYTDDKTKEEQDNDLYGKQILNLVSYKNSYLLATYEQKAEGETVSTSNILYMILNPQQDGKLSIKTEALKDAEKADTKQIKAFTGSSSYIFAAVSASDKTWQDDDSSVNENRGIAIVYPNMSASPNPTITQLNAEDLKQSTPEATAKKISVTPVDKVVCFYSADATQPMGKAKIMGSDVDMCWSTSLQRLYTGLSEVKRDDPAKEGGCFSVLVGRIGVDSSDSLTKLILSPILSNPQKGKFNVNSNKNIIGFYYDTSTLTPISISAKKIRSIVTSTNKNYVIVNCNVATTSGDTYNQIFALPVLGTLDSDGKSIPEAQIGTLSKINNSTKLPTFDGIPTNKDEMPIYDKSTPANSTKGILVGHDTKQNIDDLTDMFIYGDSVYICLGDSTSAQDQGIFQSSAIFNEDGIIISWTPWQRVGGGIYRVLGGGIDSFANFYFLCGENDKPANANTVRITCWGTTEEVNPSATTLTSGIAWEKNVERNLSSIISEIFPQEEGGVFQIINLDEQTPGFKTNQFSMMVAVGYKKVALIQTGKWDNSGKTGKFIPNTKFTINDNVFVFELELKDIAPLCFAEVSRSQTSGEGWLFVGGYGGVAVLSKADGSGWSWTAPSTGLDNLSSTEFPGTGFTFKTLTPSTGDFKYVRKLASLVSSDKKQLFIQTMNNLYVVNQSADQFKTGKVTEQKITFNPSVENLFFTDMLIIPNSDTFADTTSTKFKFILGTTNGLYCGTGYDGTKINLTALNTSMGPALHLHYISETKGKNGSIGNLFVTYANFLSNSGKVYRYTVDGSNTTSVKPVTVDDSNLFIDFYSFRGNFITDGAFGFSLLPKGPSNYIFTYMYQITQNTTETVIPLDEYLDLACSNWNVGVMTRNTASGSWLVPGDWGIRVNE